MIAVRRGAVRYGSPGGCREGPWTLVLAAGGSSRFGRPKLQRRHAGHNLLAAVTDRAIALSRGRCIVVLGCRASLLSAELRSRQARIVVNRHWREGMASSLRAGVAALPASANAVMVVLADQYAVGTRDLRGLVTAWRRAPRQPAAALFRGRPGAPAILPRSWFGRVMLLRGDAGARRLLRETTEPITLVPMAAAAQDLDAASHLARFRRAARRPGT